ncbi:MAG: PRC-barrel domain containing protein, partial [Oscillatoriales cyanobacterium RM1_1_9]|nr:PRC-barrel domain containing protein [Oscillatoriales cyanobacterium RM1_1_9]
MTLVKIKERYPDYSEEFLNGKDFKGYSVYADTSDNKVGTVEDALVDEAGQIRYFVIDTGFWIFGKKVLLPVGRARLDFNNEKLFALGLRSKDQVEALPKYDNDTVVD